jgi:hypothetical protein
MAETRAKSRAISDLLGVGDAKEWRLDVLQACNRNPAFQELRLRPSLGSRPTHLPSKRIQIGIPASAILSTWPLQRLVGNPLVRHQRSKHAYFCFQSADFSLHWCQGTLHGR